MSALANEPGTSAHDGGRMNYGRLCGLLFTIFFLAGCADRTVIVLVPDRSGATGRIAVTNDAGTVELDRPSMATSARNRSTPPAPPTLMEQKKIDALFGDLLAFEPSPPERFILHFDSNGITIDDASIALVPEILASIRRRESTDIVAVGHSDTVGDETENQALSNRRAEAVKDVLVKQGVIADFIRTDSHGESNLLIKTADNVDEPRNRRVEVTVR